MESEWTGMNAGGVFVFRYNRRDKHDLIYDGPGMPNPDAEILELLNAEWESEDQEWSAVIHGYSIRLRYQGNPVCTSRISFTGNAEDINQKISISLNEPEYAGEGFSVTIESLYVENQKMYLDITDGNTGRQVILDRKE